VLAYLGETGDEMKSSTLLFAAVFLWAGPSAAQSPANLPTSIKTIGVVTVVPSKIHVYRWGFIDTACDWLDIAPLHLEKAVFESATRALSPRYKVVRATVAPDAIIQTRNTEVMGAFKSFPSVGEQVRQLAHPESRVDAYLLVWSSHSANTCGLQPGVIGYGMGFTKSLNNPPYVHAYGEMSIIDGSTLEQLRSRPLRPANVRIENFEWKEGLAEMTPQQRQLIPTMMAKLVSLAVFSTSKDLLLAR
jgi:hypothetical protein